MRMTPAALFVVACLAAGPASAWNQHGHYAVAQVAWCNLDQDVRDRVSALLRLNPNYNDWIENVPERDRDAVAFMRSAVWADDIKYDKTKFGDYVNDPVNSAEATSNTGYESKLMHGHWHWRDRPFSTDNTPLKDPATPNIATQIDVLRKTLGSPDASDELKSYDLVWLIHLVGDAHQPLHAIQRFSAKVPGGDGGGNSARICDKPSFECSLHSAWDAALGELQSPGAVVASVSQLEAVSQDARDRLDAMTWLNESADAAEQWAYGPLVGDGPYELTMPYKVKAHEIAQQRIALAGVRLAEVLKRELR